MLERLPAGRMSVTLCGTAARTILPTVATETLAGIRIELTSMTRPHTPLIVGIGELLWDCFADQRVPGGASGNFAFQAQLLGARGIVVSAVGKDVDGEELVAFLRQQGLDTSAIQHDPEHPTSRVTVSVSDTGSPSYNIHEQVAWDFIRRTLELDDLVRSADAVCFGTLAQRNAVSRATIHDVMALVRPDCLRIYDLNLRQHYFHKDWIRTSFGLADIVKLNDEEVVTVARMLELPESEPEFGRALISQFGVRIVCMTRGGRGCLVVSQNEVHEIPGRPVKVVDTVGAGDSFTAALIVSQLKGWPLGMSCEFANRVGGLVSARKGGMPDLREEFAQLLEQYAG